MRWIWLVVWLWPAFAYAEEFPGLFAVTGVAHDDVLNIRSAPSAGAEILSAFGPHEDNIEVVDREGNWLRVPIGEQTGWVSAWFLERTGPDWGDGLPERYGCFGAEPFWHLHVNNETASWSTPEVPHRRFETVDVVQTFPPQGRYVAQHVSGTATITLFLTHGICSDGMSDATYGLHATLLWSDPEARALSGCCSIAP